MQHRFIHFYCPFWTVLNCSIEQMDQAISIVYWRRPFLLFNCCCIQGRYLLILKMLFLELVYFFFVPKAHATILRVNLNFNTWYWAWHFTFWPEHMILSLTLNTAPGPELMTLSLTLTWWTLSMCDCHSRRPPPGASWPRLSPPTGPYWSWPPGARLSRPARR